MTARRWAGLVLAAALVGACTPGSGTTRGEARLAAEREAELRASLPPGERLLARIGSLPRQELKPGTCALFLWTRVGADRKLIMHQLAGQSSITMHVDGQVTELTRTIAAGQAFFGVYTNQVVKTDRITAELTITPETVLQVPQGAQITSASIRLTDVDGWDVTMPTAGLIACQPAETDES